MIFPKLKCTFLALAVVFSAQTVQAKKVPQKKQTLAVKTIKSAKNSAIYKTSKHVRVNKKELHCLTRNIYHEARGEPYTGKLSVAQVTWNRVQSKKWGSSICKVVYEPYQFSWTLDKRKKYSSPQNDDWALSQNIAHEYLNGMRVKRLENATHFYARSIRRPTWTRSLRRVLVVGNHIFYV